MREVSNPLSEADKIKILTTVDADAIRYQINFDLGRLDCQDLPLAEQNWFTSVDQWQELHARFTPHLQNQQAICSESLQFIGLRYFDSYLLKVPDDDKAQTVALVYFQLLMKLGNLDLRIMVPAYQMIHGKLKQREKQVYADYLIKGALNEIPRYEVNLREYHTELDAKKEAGDSKGAFVTASIIKRYEILRSRAHHAIIRLEQLKGSA